MQHTADKLFAWFEKLTGQCERKNSVQLDSAQRGGSHRLLRSVLLQQELDANMPLVKLATILSERTSVLSGNPVLRLFCEQWAEYTKRLYAGCHREAQQKAAIDPRWFDKQLALITFDTVFKNNLWKCQDVDRSTSHLDTFHEGATVVKRKPEELLTSIDYFRAGGEVRCGLIMQHVAHRQALAHAEMYLQRALLWEKETLEPLHARITQELVFRDPDVLLPPTSARQMFEQSVEKRLVALRELTPEEFQKTCENEMPEMAAKMASSAMADLVSKEQSIEGPLSNRVALLLVTAWCSQLRDFWSALVLQGGQMAAFQTLLENWPEHPNHGSKRVRLLQQPVAEQKDAVAQGSDLGSRIQATLASGSHNPDIDDFLGETVRRHVLPLVEERIGLDNAKLKTVGELRQERLALASAAATADIGSFMARLADRGKLNPHILTQFKTESEPSEQIERLQREFEGKIIKETLEKCQRVRYGYQTVQQSIVDHWAKDVYSPLKAKIGSLRDYHHELQQKILHFEPWFDQAVINSEMQGELANIIGKPDHLPTTVTQALLQSVKWFSASYQH